MSEAAPFTAAPQRWVPYLRPVRLDEATPEQLEAMKVTPSNTKVSDYVLTLAHDPESLAVRSPLFNAIMYGKEGLSSAERELAATAASIVNRCVYCVSVHAARYVQLSGRDDVIAAVFADGADAAIDENARAIVAFASALSRTPAAASAAQVRDLAELGMSREAILDLVLSAAIFGWANRLMHTLGESVPAAS